MGDYFGEIALLSGEPRKASVYAVGQCTCLYISRPTFLRVLGPLQNILERNIDKYEKYQDAINLASNGEEPEQGAGGEDELEGEVTKEKAKFVHRKRERAPEEKANFTGRDKKVNKDMSSDGQAETLADKVAQDFKNPALVTPSDEFIVENSQIMMYGGLIAGQKF